MTSMFRNPERARFFRTSQPSPPARKKNAETGAEIETGKRPAAVEVRT